MANKGKIYYTDKDFTDAEVAANFKFPCIFILTDNAGKIIKQTAYDLGGNKSVFQITDNLKANINASNIDEYIETWKAKLGVGEIDTSTLMLIADYVVNGKIRADKIESLALLDLVIATETTIANFAAASGSYTFQKNDLIAVPDGSGKYSFYIYTGGTKTDVASYLAMGITSVTISQVVGLQTALDNLQSQITTEKNRNDAQDELIALKLDKPLSPNNVPTKVILGDGTTKNLSEITTDISGKEDIVNKQNNLTADGTGTKYPTVDAVNTKNSAQDTAISSKVDKPTTDGTWSLQKLGSVFTWVSGVVQNIANTDLSNVSERIFTQGNTFTWNTAGFFHYLKGLLDKTGNAAYTKVVVVHPTTGEMVTRDFADPQATTLAVQNANTSQKTAMRTALLGTATPASPTISDCFPSFIKKGVSTTIYLSGLNLTLLDPSSIWIENGATKIYATSFANINTTLIVTTWDIPIDFPNMNYLVKIQNGVSVQGLSTGSITVINDYSIINLEVANWRHIFGRNNSGVLYTVVPSMNANNIVSQNFLQTYMPYPVEDTNVVDNTSGHLWITNNFIAKDEDYEIIIDYEIFADPSGSGGVASYYIGLTNSDGSLINEITDVVVTGYITGDFRSIFGQSNWNFKQLNRIVIIKTGNKIMAKLYDYLGNYIKQQMWTLPDMNQDFALYIREPRSRAIYFTRKYYFNIRKKL